MRARKRFAQHFLDPAWAERIVGLVDPAPNDRFLEIGPGRGVLTEALAAKGARLRAIEIDRDLATELTARALPGVTVVQGDFLTLPAADIFDDDTRCRVVGNLPYNISSPILARLVALGREERIVDATLMLQREVADRLLAEPGGREYGPLAVLVTVHADRARLLTVPPGAFRPMPRVYSTVVRLQFRAPSVSVLDMALFERLVRVLFQQRRKTVLNALRPLTAAAALDGRALLDRAGIIPTRRPETLQVTELAALADTFTRAVAQGSVL